MSRAAAGSGSRLPQPVGQVKRRLLLVSYHLGPASVGGLRWHGFSKHLAQAGWQVDVVTGTPLEQVEPIPDVTVHYCPEHRTLNDFYLTTSRRLRSGSATSARSRRARGSSQSQVHAEASGGLRRIMGALRRNASQLLNFPDPARGWVIPAALRVRKLLDENRFDLVISSGPPHSAHLAAAVMARGERPPYWVDMRDPWGDVGVPQDQRTRLVRGLHHVLERWVFSTADLVLTNSIPYARDLRGQYPRLVIETIPNGVDLEKLPTGAVSPFPKTALAHVGSIYLGRDVGTVLEAMRHAADAAGQDIAQLRLVGSVGSPHRRRLDRQLERFRLEDSVEFVGLLPRPEALEILRRSTFAIVLAQGQPLQVPAKLYECVALGVPTIVITEPDSATASEGRRVGAHVFSDGDAEALGTLILDAHRGAPDLQPVARQELSYEARTQRLLGLLDSRL